MRTRSILAAAAGAALILAVVPSLAGATPADNKGTWTYTDATPDPTSTTEDASHHCHGQLPLQNPGETNFQEFKAKKSGTLSLTAHNGTDWAMEVRDKDGNVIAGTDSTDYFGPESMIVLLSKGTYQVVYCNWASPEVQITVDYSFK